MVKARVSVSQAATHYGIKIERSGLCRCPFHPDKTPSMKINETYYYCFSCHETGDVIDFTSRLFGLSPLEAAKKLAVDFGFDPNTPVSAALALPRIQQRESQRAREGRCASALIDYECLLKNRQKLFAPVHSSDDWDERFVSSGHSLPQVSYLIDCLYSADETLRRNTADSLLNDGTIRKIETWNAARREEVQPNEYNETLAA